MYLGQNCDVRFILDRKKASGSTTFVDSVDTIRQSMHLPIEDNLCDWLSCGLPCPSEEVTEWLHFGNQGRVSNRNRSSRTNFVKVFGVELLVIMIGGRLPQVRLEWIPSPFLTTKLFPHVESALGSWDPGKVVQR